MTRYSVPSERLYAVDNELTEPDGWVVMVKHAEVVAVVKKVEKFMQHRAGCGFVLVGYGDDASGELGPDCTCGLDEAQRLLKELKEG